MPKVGDVIGPWTLEALLGEGGNGKVFQASGEHEGQQARVALKIINAKKAEREPYRRFVREITTLEQIGNQEGIMPVLAAHLPESAAREDQPWLAMPIATPIRDALEGASLETVVEAVATIATALDRLQREHDIGHRDLKPDNLYRFGDDWVVGDFGLVAAPNRDELTRNDRPMGPAHYVPYEMIQDPANADPHKADVFSLGKTLWVLATEQRYPPQGHQPHRGRGYTIADMRPHAKAAVLDRLVDRMTRVRPEERPTKAEVAAELGSWLALQPSGAVAIDLSSQAARFREQIADELSSQDLQEERRDMAIDAFRALGQMFGPINDALRQLHPRADIDQMGDKYTENMLTSTPYLGSADVVWQARRLSSVSVGPDYHRFALRVGRGLELTDAGDLLLRAYIDVGIVDVMGAGFHWEGDWTAEVGTASADAMLAEGVSEIARQLEAAVEVFVDHTATRTA